MAESIARNGQSDARTLAPADDRPLGELARDLSEESSRLARLEVELAKAEIAQKGKQIGIGAGAFGGAGLLGLYALAALVTAGILGLAQALDPWLAALIVAAVLGAAAGLLALVGRNRVDAGTPPTPDRAISNSKRDIEAAKRSVKEARNA